MGDILELRAGDATARLLPHAGGRVSALRLVRPSGGVVDVLDPYPEDYFDPLRWGKGGIYPLMPYSNRIANATVRVNGEDIALKPHPDAAPHTLHGNAHAQPWQMAESDGSTAVMVLDSAASAAWPWRYAGRLALRLEPSALVMRIEIRNTDARSMPAGVGLHPYFRHEAHGRVGYAAKAVWQATPEFLATTSRPPHTDEIYAPPRPLPQGGLTDYVGGWDGTAQIDLPGGARLRITADAALGHLVVHRPDNLAYLCLEPVSHVANGFNLAARGVADTGTVVLAPGESLGATVRFELQEAAP